MSWQCIRLTYELLSPLHIGHHKIGNVQRTRCCVPARNLWGAVTERLTRSGFSGDWETGDYGKIGKWMADHLAFTYFFVAEGDKLLYPQYGDGGLTYGKFPRCAFERRYFSAHVTTALDPGVGAAETGSLHEVEFIANKYVENEQPQTTRLTGWVFLNEEASQKLGDVEVWNKWLGDLFVGGERRYGFGHLRLCQGSDGWQPCEGKLNGYALELGGSRPCVRIEKGRPLLAHAPVGTLDARGAVEPVVGRSTTTRAINHNTNNGAADSTSFGKNLTTAVVCWTPGTVVTKDVAVTIQKENGLWETKNP